MSYSLVLLPKHGVASSHHEQLPNQHLSKTASGNGLAALQELLWRPHLPAPHPPCVTVPVTL